MSSHLQNVVPGVHEGCIQPPITVWGPRYPVLVREIDFTLKVQCGESVLLKHDDVGRTQPKVAVLLEELQCWLFGVFTGHYVPNERGGGEETTVW